MKFTLDEKDKAALRGELSPADFEAHGMKLFAKGLANVDPLRTGPAAFTLTDLGKSEAERLRREQAASPALLKHCLANGDELLGGLMLTRADARSSEQWVLEGFFLPKDDTAMDRLKQIFFDGVCPWLAIDDCRGGKIRGPFQITGLEYSGETNRDPYYHVTLATAGQMHTVGSLRPVGLKSLEWPEAWKREVDAPPGWWGLD